MSELVFIVDRSGSMGIEPMKKAAQALELLLHSLPENCYFNVISFGSRYDSLFPKSQLYSEKSLSKALNLAQTMTSNYGGTKIHNVLEWVFKNSRDDMPISVFLITDGRVWDADEIVELVRENEEKKKDDLRLFSLGIGDSVSHNLVESVARAGRGYAQFVTNDERMDRKVIEMLKSALKPPIKDYKITWTNTDLLELNDDKSAISFMSDETESLPSIKIQQAPYIIPPIYTGIRFMAYCILEKNIEPCKTITLKATSHDDRPMVLDIPLDPVTLQGSKIHRLAARKLIQDLDYKKSFIHKHPKNVGKFIPASFVKEHIVKLGKTYNLASKFTSFIAIDERNNEISEVLIKSRTIPQKRNVPQLAPQFSTLQSSSNFMTIGRFATTDTAIAGLATTSRINIMDLVRSGIRSLVSAKSGPKETKEAQSVSLLYSECGLNIESEFNHKESQIGSVFDDSKSEVNHKESQIENLFGFLELQSFDGKFLLNDSFYKFFYKNDLNDFINLKQEIIKEMGDIGIKEIEEILTTSIALAYLEIIIFKKFKDESELCYEKAVKALKKMVEDEEKEKLIGEKAKEWIKNWVINGK
ncbi:18810_t:CDS:2 [Rhizophagus irregularis]|nr:18810_t:CDS:2 [Rhizophagus irregularis]